MPTRGQDGFHGSSVPSFRTGDVWGLRRHESIPLGACNRSSFGRAFPSSFAKGIPFWREEGRGPCGRTQTVTIDPSRLERCSLVPLRTSGCQ
jgi:hypothetical protein